MWTPLNRSQVNTFLVHFYIGERSRIWLTPAATASIAWSISSSVVKRPRLKRREVPGHHRDPKRVHRMVQGMQRYTLNQMTGRFVDWRSSSDPHLQHVWKRPLLRAASDVQSRTIDINFFKACFKTVFHLSRSADSLIPSCCISFMAISVALPNPTIPGTLSVLLRAFLRSWPPPSICRDFDPRIPWLM